MEEKTVTTTPPSEPAPDWEVGTLYSRSWEIVKKHKFLWIFGIAFAGYGSSFNFNGSGDFDSFQKLFQNAPESQNQMQQVNQVLGESINPLGQAWQQIIGSIPFYFYILLGVEILFMVVVGIIIALVYRAWVHGSLISGASQASTNQNPSFSSVSEQSFKAIKRLIWLDMVPGLIFVLAVIVLLGGISLGFIFGNTAVKIISGLLVFVGIIALVISSIMLNITLIWAPRQVIIDNKPASKAFFDSLKITKKKIWSSLLIGLVNMLLSLAVFGIPIAILVGVIFGGALAGSALDSSSVIAGLIIVGVVLLVAFVIGFTLLSGMFNAFKATVWTLAYEKIRGKYDK